MFLWYLCCFHFLAIGSSAAVNLGCMYISKLWFCLGIMPRYGIAGLFVRYIFASLRNPVLLFVANEGPSSQSYGFSSSLVWMWELDYKESWVLKNWCFWIVVLEKTLESPFDSKEIQPVHPKGNQPEYSLEGLMLKLKLQYFSHLMQRTDSFEKTLMLRRIEGMREGDDRMRWLEGITDSMDRSK